MIITFAVIIKDFTDLSLTEYKNQAHLIKWSSNENYIRHLQKTQDKSPEWHKLTPKEIEDKRIAERNDYLETIKGDATAGIIDSFSWLIVSMVCFIIHWWLYKNEKC